MASTYRSEVLGYALSAVVPATLLMRRRWRVSASAGAKGSARVVRSLGIAALLSGPVIASAVAGGSLHGNDATLALLLCPVVIAVAGRAGSGDLEVDLTGLLWPSLAGLVALLLLLPEPSLRQIRSWIGLAILPIAVGLGASVADRAPSGEDEGVQREFLLPAIFGLLMAAGVVAGLGVRRSASGSPPLSLAAAALDGSSALLTLLALGRLGAFRWSAQFLLIPLLGIGEGILFLHPVLNAQSYFALGLLTLSCGYQLFATPAGGLPRGDRDGSGVSEA